MKCWLLGFLLCTGCASAPLLKQKDYALPAFKYTYRGDNGLPAFTASLNLDMDLLKSFPHSLLNEMADAAEEVTEDLAKQFIDEYGEAATVDARIDELVKDETGNVQSVRMYVDIKIDLTKLPPAVPLEDVPLVTGRIDFGAHVKGVSLAVSGELNPKFSGFSPDQEGLREYIERLLGNNEKTYEQLQTIVGWIDRFTEDVVNRPPETRAR